MDGLRELRSDFTKAEALDLQRLTAPKKRVAEIIDYRDCFFAELPRPKAVGLEAVRQHARQGALASKDRREESHAEAGHTGEVAVVSRQVHDFGWFRAASWRFPISADAAALLGGASERTGRTRQSAYFAGSDMDRTLLMRLAAVLTLFSASAAAQDRVLKSQNGPIAVETLAAGLEHPWALAYLPDGRMLVTERPGRLRIVDRDGNVSGSLKGVPKVFAQGQGGLLDVALDPQFARNKLVYLSYAEPGQGGASTAVARGKLGEQELEDVQVIFRQKPKVDGPNHFGSRLVFAPDGTLFVTLGERFKFEPAQDLSNHLGTIVRINPDGSVPKDNPFVGKQGALPEIWSYGHRNIQGAAIHPETGVLWAHEMGPKGGDELNIPEAGKNYGWPIVSWGSHYDDTPIPDPPTRPEFAGSLRHWNPVISPSGMTFYTADRMPGWKGSLLIGGLSSEALIRLTLQGNDVTDEERLEMGSRIRDVRQAPDGAVHLLTDEDNGKLLRLTPRSENRG